MRGPAPRERKPAGSGRSTSTAGGTATEDASSAPRFHGALRAGPRAPAQRPRRSSTDCPFDLGPASPARALGPARPADHDRSRRRAARPATSWSPICATPGGTTPAGGRPAWPWATSCRSARSWRGTRSSTGRAASTTRVVRRRFEVNDGILGWGSGAFAAVAHRDNEVLDWRGPHPVQEPGRYAPTGQSGHTDDHARDLRHEPDRDDRLRAQRHRRRAPVAPRDRARHGQPSRSLSSSSQLNDGRPGSDLIVAAVTVFRGSGNPLARSAALPGAASAGCRPARREVDLGTIIRTPPAAPDVAAAGRRVVGWGSDREPAAAGGGRRRPDRRPGDGPRRRAQPRGLAGRRAGTSWPGAPAPDPAGRRSIELLPAAAIPVEVEIVDPLSGERVAGAGPVHDRRRPLPAAARPSRRGQPGVLRGHRRPT